MIKTIKQLKTLETITNKITRTSYPGTCYVLIKQEEGQLEYVATNGVNLCILKNKENNKLTQFFLNETKDKNILISKDAIRILKNIKNDDDFDVYIESFKKLILSDDSDDALRYPDYKSVIPTKTVFEAVKIHTTNCFFDVIRILHELDFHDEFEILQDAGKKVIFIKTENITIISMN